MAASNLSPAMPDGFEACPLNPEMDSGVRICLVVRTKADAVAGWFLPLGESFDSRSFLGCLTDQRGAVLQWIQIRLQTTDIAEQGPESAGELWTNHRLDLRWQNDCKAGADSLALRGQWESEHPVPLFFDSATRRLTPLVDSDSGQTWRLCTNDALLASCGLPPYATSLYRYLYVTFTDGRSHFLAVQDDAPQNESVALLRDVMAGNGRRPWNPAGGLMRLMRWNSMVTGAFLDVLAGLPYVAKSAGKVTADFDNLGRILKDTGETLSAGTVFLGRHGQRGRIIESLHLKLKFLADAVDCVRRFTHGTHRPLLNLRAESFQTHLAAPSVALPFLWTASLELVDFGHAVELEIPGSDSVFMDGIPASPDVYKPAFDTRPLVTEKAVLRLRSVTTAPDGTCIVDGTLANLEGIVPQPSDLVCVRAALADQRILLTGSAETQSALAAGEVRFRSNRFPLTGELLTAMQAAQGTAFQPVRLQCLPRKDTAFDLYALTVLALRALVVHPGNPLPVAVDELRGFVAQIAREFSADKPLPQRVADLLLADNRWNKSLGAQNVFPGPPGDEAAGELIPAGLWTHVVALLVRMVPAAGPDSFCRTYGIIPPAGMAGLLDPVVDVLSRLLIQTRSLIVIDWQVNREVHAVIRRFQLGL